ncbi:putative membrane protein [Golovinomyces cichoracearum]|uniref:Putative membrane protein n=1 Tax=Golovinomyces cichoracearum TaxID=62708 RepID=A0A420J722_9PEZI|nr:putative membrane protein [Golovinomyces cichoracearum]
MMAINRGNNSPRLPVQQLAILAVCRFAEPVVLTSVYPYIPEMIESFGIPKDKIAKWAGIANSVFAISQALTAVAWGQLSDRFGRKPAIITSLVCTMICSLIWGFSKNLAMAITTRGIQGAFNGNAGTIRTMVAEMVQEKELQPRAFSIMPMVWSLGSILGPILGGFFASPAKNIPGLFGDNAFFIKYPFALPNILTSAFFALGITTAFLFLKETHHAAKQKTDYGLLLGKKLKKSVQRIFNFSNIVRRYRQSAGDGHTETSPLLAPVCVLPENTTASSSKCRGPFLSEVFTLQSTLILISYTFLSMHSVTFDQLIPIFMHSPPEAAPQSLGIFPIKFSGGFGLDSSSIGILFTINGVFICIMQFLVFPPLARRFGVLNCFKLCSILFPAVYFLTPYMALVQSSSYQQFLMLITMTLKSIANIVSFPCAIILLTNSARSLKILGTLNGFAVSITSIGRAVGPAICGPAFTWGMNKNYIIIPWWILSLMAIVGAAPIWWMLENECFANSDFEGESTEDVGKTQSSSVIAREQHLTDNPIVSRTG